MNKILIFTFVVGILIFNQSCLKENNNLTNLEKKAIIDSAKITVQKVFESSNNLDFVGGLNYYSDEPDALYK